MKWIDEHRHLLKPPVGNMQIWEDREFMVFVVGGPNERYDFHINQGEEFFYQIEGDCVLKVLNRGEYQDITIREGEVFLLPARMPHSPQRKANTIGLVIERKRLVHEKDAFVWFCQKCDAKLHEEIFLLKHIVDDLPPIFTKFWETTELRTCKKCGTVMEKP